MNDDGKKTLETLFQQTDWYSQRVSEQLRAVAIGILAALWAVVTAKKVELGPGSTTVWLFRLAFIFVTLTLCADFVQYFILASYVRSRFRKIEQAIDENNSKVDVSKAFDNEDCGYRAGLAFYWVKMGLFLVAITLFLLCMFRFTFKP